ncbi:TauD/TfdA family dioxygenase [Streptomyces hazeniae]
MPSAGSTQQCTPLTPQQGAPPMDLPARVGPEDIHHASAELDRRGAVILAGYGSSGDALTVAAAQVLGSRLSRLFPQRVRASHDGGPVHLHADSLDLTVDIGGVRHRRRHPDEDYVLIQCLKAAPAGGDSFALDAYRFADACRTADPELWRFLTTQDVDLYGAWPHLRGLPASPRVARHVEYTRTGRRIVRRTDGAVPLHRDPDLEHVRTMLDRFAKIVHEEEPPLPRFRLGEGDILVLDNYRVWHGRDAHTGERAVRILTVCSSDAR